MAGGGEVAHAYCDARVPVRGHCSVSAPFPPHGSNLGGLVRLGDKSLLQAGPDLQGFRSSKLRRMCVGGGGL